jgi:hypothetical protein
VNIKVTYAAIGAALILGLFGAKEWSENISLQSQVNVCGDRQKEGVDRLQLMRTFFSGKVSTTTGHF